MSNSFRSKIFDVIAQTLDAWGRGEYRGIFEKARVGADKVVQRLRWERDKFRGYQELTVGGTTSKFAIHSRALWRKNKYRCRKERDQLNGLLDNLSSDDVFYDIGAGTGLYSCFAAKRHPPSTVVAFEPFPPNVEQIRRNVRLNKVNVDIYPFAISDDSGIVSFTTDGNTNVGYGMGAISTTKDGDWRVASMTLDGLVREYRLPLPNVVKVDVEGAEPLVVKGGEKIFRSPSCRTVLCEIHKPTSGSRPSIEDFGCTVEGFRKKMEELGYCMIKSESEEVESRFFVKFKRLA